MSVSRRKQVFAKILTASGALVVTALLPLAAAGGDDFSDNLFSDLAPILALFGGRVAEQFLSQSVGWADNVLFAMAPLGVIAAIVGAIRVAGPPTLKVIVGRARENRAAAEVDLVSSTSDDVCDLWNGQAIVRMMGPSPVLELIFLPSRKDEADCGLLTLGEPTDCLVARSRSQIIYSEGVTSRDKPEPEVSTPRVERIGDAPKNVPNIALNLYPEGSRCTLGLLAAFAIVLQLSVLVYSGLVSYWLKLEKRDRIVSYGYPLTAAGTVLLVVGMLICSHVVEQSTVQQTWDIVHKPKDLKEALGPRVLWLQRGSYTNSQNFPPFCIIGHGARDSIMTFRRRESFEEDSTFLIRFYSRLRRMLNRNQEGPNTSAGSRKYLEFLVVAGTLTSVFGFIVQSIGLQSMHWSAPVAQLAATMVMIFIRALVYLQNANPPPTHRIPDGHELDWLATRIGGDPEPLLASLDKPKQSGDSGGALRGILDEECWNWSLVTGVGRDKFASLDASQFDSGLNDVFRIRKRLSKLSNWTGPASKYAISVARSVEAVMNTIFTQKEYPEMKTLEWSVYGHRGGSKPGRINLSVKREGKRWVACAAEIEAVLSLWLYSMKENNKGTIPNSALPGDGTRDDWLRCGHAAPQQRAIRLLGEGEEYYCRDLHWYLGEGAGIISQVQVEESPISEIKYPAPPPTSNIFEIETRFIFGFANLGSEISPISQRFTRFRTQAIRLYSYRNEATGNSPDRNGQIERRDHLAVISDSQLELLLAQDLFSGFMWDAADKMQALSVESSTLHQTDRIQQTGSAWFDSLRLTNTALSSMVREIVRAGLGKPEDAYASIIPALSIKRKLPIPHCLVTQAREKAQNYVAHWNWKGATNVYSKLLGVSITFGKTSPFAVEATATVYEGLRAARAKTHLWERWLHSPTIIEELKEQELVLHKVLGTADEQVVLGLRIMHKVQCPRGDGGCTGGIDGHRKVADSESNKLLRDRIIGLSSRDKCRLKLTSLHCAVLADDLLGIDRFLESVANVDAKDVLGWTPLHYAATQGLRVMAEALLLTAKPAGADPNIKDFAGRTALHHAVGAGREGVVRLLLEKGAYIGAKDNHHSTPLHIAAENGDSNMAQVLLACGAGKEPRDKFGYAPLHCAANNGHLKLVQILLRENMDKESEDRKGQTPLHHAAYNRHMGVVQLLLENGADTEAKNHLGDTPLHYAATHGRLELAQLLLEKGADKEAKSHYGERPLHYAAGMGHLDIVQLFLEKGADKEAENIISQTPLHHAADSRHFDVVQLLLEKGANKEAEDKVNLRPLHYAASSGHLEAARLLLEEGAGNEGGWSDGSGVSRPLHFAAEKGCLDIVQLLLEDGANKEAEDFQGDRPLHLAARYGHPEVVRLLLEKGANNEAEGNQGARPLHKAAGGGSLDVVQLLLENGADKEAADNQGDRPLHRAAHYGQPEVVRLLLQKDANIEAEDNQGGRPLHRAARCGRLNVVQLLLEKGADKEAEDNQGDRPLEIAINRGRSEVVQLLLDNGADRGAKGKKRAGARG